MKNIQKGQAYKLAHSQINAAIKGERPFPIEAIAIEESILSDRLYSALVARLPDKAKETKKQGRGRALFGTILGKIADARTFVPVPEFLDLDAALSKKGGVKCLFEWKEGRNKFIHGLARSLEPGEPTEIGSDVYYEKGLDIACVGLDLVRIVKSWSQSCIRAANRVAKKKV